MKGIKRKLIAVVLALTVSMTMSSAIVFADSTDAVASDSNTTSESQNVKDNSNKEQTEEATKDKNDNDKTNAVKSDAQKSDTTKTEQNANSLKSTSGNQKLAAVEVCHIKFDYNGAYYPGTTAEYYYITATKGMNLEGKYWKGDGRPIIPEDPTREGYKFLGWSPKVETIVTKDVTYTAQWEKLYTITYDFDGGLNSTGESSKVYKDLSKGDATPTVETPTKEGYKFAGWNTTVADTVSDDVTYTAQWKKLCTVTYDFDGGLDSAGESSKIFNDICEGDATPTVEEPTKEGYDFAGWNTTVADTVSDDVTYTAQWKQKIPDIDQDTDNPKYNDDKDKTDKNSNINDSNGLTKSDKYYTAYVKETTEKAKEKKESKKDDSAKTGDNMPIGMLFGLMAVAASGGALTLGKRRKEQE